MESPIKHTCNPAALIPQLQQALGDTLPGLSAQMQMAPAVRQRHPYPGENPRNSAVLALLHTSPRGLALIFTLRSTSLRHHGGQISFPGGGVEPADLTYADTALRETQEELGIATCDIEVLGELTPLFIAPSHNMVHPYVGWLPALPQLVPDPAEVAAVRQVSVGDLLDPRTLDTYTWRRNGTLQTAPCYRVAETCIWGATAMILNELLEIIRRFRT